MGKSIQERMDQARFELFFEPLVEGGANCYAFPCDSRGNVDMNGLDVGSRNDYLYARALVGLKLRRPTVRTS
jgi:hypothetical protein